MPLGHHAPWQWLTRRHGLRLMQRLELRFDPEWLREDLRRVTECYALEPHFRRRDADWEGIGLVAPGGDPRRDRKRGAACEKTEVLRIAPYLEKIIDSFACEKQRVRLMRLAPAGSVAWHYDWDECLDYGNARLHVPIQTNARAEAQISHLDYRWQPGECWYGDFSFPHRLANRGDSARVHLVIDVVRNAFVDGLLAESLAEPPVLRARVRRQAQWLVTHLSQRPRKRLRRLVQRISSAASAASNQGR
jgi:hypothetical protein